MANSGSPGLKKSFYVFLSAFLGVLLFLVLYRLAYFLYLVLVVTNPSAFGFGLSDLQLQALDYLVSFFVLMLGAWYGIWLGLHWYEKVYEEGSHKGAFHHLAIRYWPRRAPENNLESKVARVRQKLEGDLWQLENLTKSAAHNVVGPRPIKRKVIRKRAPRKIQNVKGRSASS